jgi:hypothetical protein
MGKRARCALFGALLVALCPGGLARAADSAGVRGLFRDMRLGVQARRALAADEGLKKLNLTVRVENGEATVWGPVPSSELERRAVALLGEVNGIRRVRSELYIVPGAGEPAPALLALLPPPTVVQVASPDRDTGELKRDLLTPAATTSGGGRETGPAPLSVPRLDGPRPVRGAQVEHSDVTRPPGPSLVEVIEELRRADRRYDGIRFTVRGGVVRVSADDVAEEDVEAFSRAVRAVPGVKEVK